MSIRRMRRGVGIGAISSPAANCHSRRSTEATIASTANQDRVVCVVTRTLGGLHSLDLNQGETTGAIRGFSHKEACASWKNNTCCVAECY